MTLSQVLIETPATDAWVKWLAWVFIGMICAALLARCFEREGTR